MTTNLRVSLTILSLGFGIEGAAELASFASHGAFQPGVNVLFILPVAATLAGLLFVWIGQHEWNALHRARVRQAHRVFALSLLGAVIAALEVALLMAEPSLGVPLWAKALFGAAVGSLVLGTFVTYALLVFHLVPSPGKGLLLASLAWALVVAGLVGAAIGANLPKILSLASQRTLSIPNFVGPVDSLASYLFVSYFLLLAAYVDAHRRVVRGAAREGEPTAAPAGAPSPSDPTATDD